MKILIAARLKAKSGNNATALRIREHLLTDDHDVQVKCVTSYRNSTELKRYVSDYNIDLIIGIHAFRAGKLIYSCGIPYIIIFGGTDLNEHFREEEKLEFMKKAVNNAKKCVAFNDVLRQKGVTLLEASSEKIIVQPQAVEIFKTGHEECTFEDILKSTKMSADLVLNNNAIIFLLVAGLRPVKDPLYLVESLSEWHHSDGRIYLLIVGPKIDINYSTQFKDKVQSSAGIVFIDGLSPTELQNVMRKVFALVNSSVSEGMASSILEAMSLGLPVIARRNDGNSAIIDHRKTGLLFDTPKEFRSLAEELLSSDDFKSQIVKNAKEYVIENHSLEKERFVYCKLVSSILSGQ